MVLNTTTTNPSRPATVIKILQKGGFSLFLSTQKNLLILEGRHSYTCVCAIKCFSLQKKKKGKSLEPNDFLMSIKLHFIRICLM